MLHWEISCHSYAVHLDIKEMGSFNWVSRLETGSSGSNSSLCFLSKKCAKKHVATDSLAQTLDLWTFLRSAFGQAGIVFYFVYFVFVSLANLYCIHKTRQQEIKIILLFRE